MMSAMDIIGRAREVDAIVNVLERARGGVSGVLVVRGEAGTGKTVLLQQGLELAVGFEVTTLTGVESEVELGYAGIHRLVQPMIGNLASLPGPQRIALAGALGLEETSGSPDRFRLGLAILTLLSEAAKQKPLLCVIDDAQWLDRESLDAIAFVARRLLADPVVLLVAVRTGGERETTLAGMPSLEIVGLDDADARELLTGSVPDDIATSVVERIVGVADGNPLALIELGSELTQAQRRGDADIHQAHRSSAGAEAKFVRDLRVLPPDTQLLLLIAAADSSGRLRVVFGAAGALGIRSDASRAAETAGLVSFENGVTFRHPLVRSAAISIGSDRQLDEVHRALADQFDREVEPDRRALHLAATAHEFDDEIADELDRCSTLARLRGSPISAADLLVRSAQLTSSRHRRGSRLFAAAMTTSLARSLDRGKTLLEEAVPLLDDGPLKANASWLRGVYMLGLRDYRAAPSTLLAAAIGLDAHDRGQSREAILDSITASTMARHQNPEFEIESVLAALDRTPPLDNERPLVNTLLAAHTTLLRSGFVEAVPELHMAVRTWNAAPVSVTDVLRWSLITYLAARELFDEAAVRTIFDAELDRMRSSGALTSVQALLFGASSMEIEAGRFARAAILNAEAHDLNMIVDGRSDYADAIDIELLAWRGRHTATLAAAARMLRMDDQHGAGSFGDMANMALAVLANAERRYEDALSPALQVAAGLYNGRVGRALPEVIEAAVGMKAIDTAEAALADLERRARATGTPLALGLASRGRALFGASRGAADVERHFRDSVEHLERSSAATALARSHLVYGEWLQSDGRANEASVHLRTALASFTHMGANAFADRTRLTLLEPEEQQLGAFVDLTDTLTSRERQVAELLASGTTTSEVAAALFVTSTTVEHHLAKAYQKLRVNTIDDLRKTLGI